MNALFIFSSVTFSNAVGVLPIFDPNAITSPSNATTPGVGATPKDGAGGIKPPSGVTGSVVPLLMGIGAYTAFNPNWSTQVAKCISGYTPINDPTNALDQACGRSR